MRDQEKPQPYRSVGQLAVFAVLWLLVAVASIAGFVLVVARIGRTWPIDRQVVLASMAVVAVTQFVTASIHGQRNWKVVYPPTALSVAVMLLLQRLGAPAAASVVFSMAVSAAIIASAHFDLRIVVREARAATLLWVLAGGYLGAMVAGGAVVWLAPLGLLAGLLLTGFFLRWRLELTVSFWRPLPASKPGSPSDRDPQNRSDVP